MSRSLHKNHLLRTGSLKVIQLLTVVRAFLAPFIFLTLLPLTLWAADFEFKTQKIDTEDEKNSPLKVVGCLQVTDKEKSPVAMSKCLENIELKKTIKSYWKLSTDRKNVTGCEQVTESTRPAASIKDLPLEKCVAELPYEKAWTVNGRNEIDGCKGIAKYRSAEFSIADMDSCYKDLTNSLEYTLVFEIGKNPMTHGCEVKSGGRSFANPKYNRQKCSLADENLNTVVLIQGEERKTENITTAWSENINTTCIAIAEESLRTLGTVEKDRCDELILKIVDGKRKLVGAPVAKRTYSFRKMLLDPKMSANMQGELGAACVASVNKITRSGRSLASRILANSATPLGQVRVHTGVQDNLFYHWTSSDGLFALFKLRELNGDEASARAKKENIYEQMFYFLRTRSADMYQFWRRVFYVAEDTKSSGFLGSNLLEFTLDPKSKTVVYNLPTWQASMDEVAEKYPELAQTCKMNLDWKLTDTFGSLMFSNMFFIVAEDSGITVIEFNQGGRWFQILGSEPFVSLKHVR